MKRICLHRRYGGQVCEVDPEQVTAILADVPAAVVHMRDGSVFYARESPGTVADMIREAARHERK